jgi:hypothetical protein
VKAWIRRWLGTAQPSKHDFEELLAASIEALGKAQAAHISDLRVLIDKGSEREAQLAEMVRIAMEHQFYRPTVTRGTNPDNKIASALPPEHMQDVTVFDSAEDEQMVKAQEAELAALITEQNERGAHKVAAA